MYRIAFVAVFSLGLALATLGSSTPAEAHGKCKVFGFEVNDFGKKGPTADAKRLLDVHVANWAKENKIKSFHAGSKKTVSCRIFIDLGFFDEWTCTAKQTICH